MPRDLTNIRPIACLKSVARRFVHNISRQLAMRQLTALCQLENPFVMVVMPGTLHVARLASNLVPQSENLVVLLNGVRGWERVWARQNLRCKSFVTTPTSLGHSVVLEALFESFEQPFGIMDPDLLVLDPSCLREMKALDSKTSVNAYFYEDSGNPTLRVPMTYFMFFNRALLQTIRKRYGVGCASSHWGTLPEEVKARLASLGFGPTLYLQQHLGYFDTLQVLILLALAEGFSYRTTQQSREVPKSSDRVCHVGAVSYWHDLHGTWKLRGAYFSQRALELCGDNLLREYYHQRYGRMSVRDVLAKSEDKIGRAFIEYADKLIGHGLKD